MGCINTLRQELRTAKTYEHNLFDERSVVFRHRCHMAAKFYVLVDGDHSQLPVLYCSSEVHKRAYKSRILLILVHVHILLLSCLYF